MMRYHSQVKSKGSEIKDKILHHYYQDIYKNYLFQSGAQYYGIKYFERFLEKCWNSYPSETVNETLEIGAGQGEHWKYVKVIPSLKYVALDIRPLIDHEYLDELAPDFKSKIEFVLGTAESMPFDPERFDRTFSTCLLHHVDNPLDVLLEARRVTKVGGQIVFILPTDPGLMNLLVKKITSYRRLSKFTNYDPKLFYALDHKNHISSLVALIQFVFKDDEVNFKYSPFMIPSSNLNLIVGVNIIKSSSNPVYVKD